MYVPVKKGEPGHLGESAFGNGCFGGVRLCETCVRPEFAAAVLGAALVGSPTDP